MMAGVHYYLEAGAGRRGALGNDNSLYALCSLASSGRDTANAVKLQTYMKKLKQTSLH